MTRDEILTMKAGPEMNALVAEYVIGQTDFKHPGFFWNEGTTEDGKDGWDGFNCPQCGASKDDTGKCVKNYSTDIAAAWMVLEKFTDVDIEKAGENYRVTINAFAQADEHTLPLAICQAALLAVLEPA